MAILFGTSGNNTITGGAAADFILGYDPAVPSPDGNDSLSGAGGNDSIYGGDGNDTINGGSDTDSTFGGNGNDRIVDDDFVNFDIHNGGAGIDTIDYSLVTFAAGAVTINLSTGLTSVAGGNTETILNFENVEGSQGSETITGSSGNNVLNGNGGDDTINGGGGNDTLNGGSGTDTLNGGDGNDNIRSDGDGGLYRGDAGNDVMFSGLGGETMDGGTGVDTIDHTVFSGNYVFNMATGLTNFGGESYINFENATMGAGNDSVTGNASNNLINGNDGNDTINGGSGNDTLLGDLGDDILVGGSGVDTMTDGSGNDDYRFLSITDSGVNAGNRDILTDFTSGVDDIDLSAIDSDILAGGNQAFEFIGTGAFGSGVLIDGEVRYFHSGGNTIVQIDREGDGNLTVDMEIQLTGIINLVATDFIL